MATVETVPGGPIPITQSLGNSPFSGFLIIESVLQFNRVLVDAVYHPNTGICSHIGVHVLRPLLPS